MGDCDIDGEEEVELRARRSVAACVNYDNGNEK